MLQLRKKVQIDIIFDDQTYIHIRTWTRQFRFNFHRVRRLWKCLGNNFWRPAKSSARPAPSTVSATGCKTVLILSSFNSSFWTNFWLLHSGNGSPTVGQRLFWICTTLLSFLGSLFILRETVIDWQDSPTGWNDETKSKCLTKLLFFSRIYCLFLAASDERSLPGADRLQESPLRCRRVRQSSLRQLSDGLPAGILRGDRWTAERALPGFLFVQDTSNKQSLHLVVKPCLNLNLHI